MTDMETILNGVRDRIAYIDSVNPAQLVAEKIQLERMLATFEPVKTRSKKGAAMELIRRVRGDDPALNREQAIEAAQTIASEEKIIVTRDALGRAYTQAVREDEAALTVPHET